jgi:hypothetical protein
VPGRILVVVVAELTVHGFWVCEGLIAELLGILEKDGVAGSTALAALWVVGGDSGEQLFLCSLVLDEEAFEKRDGGAEVVVKGHEQVDVVEVFLAAEAVGEVVARIDGGTHFAAIRTEEAEVAFADFGWRAFATERGDGDGHRQVVAKSA